MGRIARIDSTGRWFHVVNRGVARQSIYRDDRDRVEFERLIGLSHDRFGVRVHAYAWMGNHYHMLIECPEGQLSKAMHIVGSLYVRHFNDRHGRDGPLFRDRFFARIVNSDAYLMQLVRYIHRNPTAIVGEAGLTEYRWSSLRSYLGARRAPRWLVTSTLLEMLGGLEPLRAFVLDRATSANSRTLDEPAWAGLVALFADEHVDDLGVRSERQLATMLLEHVSDSDRKALDQHLAFPSKKAHQMATLRARRLQTSNPAWRTAIGDILAAAS